MLKNKLCDIRSLLLKEYNLDILSGSCLDFAFAIGELINKIKSFKIYCVFLNENNIKVGHMGLIWDEYYWDGNGAIPLENSEAIESVLIDNSYTGNIDCFNPIFRTYFNWEFYNLINGIFYSHKRIRLIKNAIKNLLCLKERRVCFEFESDKIRYDILNNPIHNYFDRDDFVLELSDFYEFNQWNCYVYQDQNYIIFYELWDNDCLAGLKEKYGNCSEVIIKKYLPERMKRIGEALNLQFDSFYYDEDYYFESEHPYKLSKTVYLKYF